MSDRIERYRKYGNSVWVENVLDGFDSTHKACDAGKPWSNNSDAGPSRRTDSFGVIEEDGMAYRGTFLVNPEGKIKIAGI